MSRFLFLFLILLAEPVIAGNADLANLVDQMDTAYSEKGQDNNYFGITDELPYNNLVRIIPISQKEDIRRVLKKCVFFKDGAYGRHLDDKTHARLARKYMKRIEILPAATKVYEIKNIKIDGLNNGNCALSLVDKDETLVFQGVTQD